MNTRLGFFCLARRAVLRMAPVLGLVVLASCGGGGDGSIQPPATTGTVAWSINDASGDFTSYAVTVNQITLTRDDGVVVKALPAPVTVDLAQLVGESELFGSTQLPSGTYTKMSIDVDYSNADISAENAQGQVIDLTPVTSSGSPAGVQTLTVQFSSSQELVVRQGTPVLASLDFDLAASNTVNFSASPPTVTVSPLLYASINPTDLPYTRASGTLVGVDAGNSNYTIDVVPLFYTGTKDFGQLTVATDSQTYFAVNGTGYVGSQGLQAMGSVAAGTATLAYGTYEPSSGQFNADEVFVGSSVPGVDMDAVHGSVVARSGDTLTVVGLTFVHSTGDELYHSTVTVSLGASTVVYKAGDPTASVGIGDISVGQRVTVLGTLTNTDPTALAMDAGATDTGYVRLAPSQVSGTVVSINSAMVVLDLGEVNNHPVGWFNFAGTGSTSTLDADPSNYEVNTGSLSLTGLSVGGPAEIDGFVQAFGQAPPDFNAATIGNYTAKGAQLMVAWRPTGTTAPFTTENPDQLVIDLQDPNIGPIAVLRLGGPPVDLTSLPASPSIVPPSSGTGLYAIKQGGVVTMHVGFANFVSDLQQRLNGSTGMTGFFARGGYDAGSNTYTATRIAVHLK